MSCVSNIVAAGSCHPISFDSSILGILLSLYLIFMWKLSFCVSVCAAPEKGHPKLTQIFANRWFVCFSFAHLHTHTHMHTLTFYIVH